MGILVTVFEKLAEAIGSLAYQVKCLGLGNAGTDQGALEFAAVSFKDGCGEIAAAIRDHGFAEKDLAAAVRELAQQIDMHGDAVEDGAAALEKMRLALPPHTATP